MQGHCPTCKQALPDALAVDLNRNLVTRGGRQVKVAPQAAVILHALTRKQGAVVSHAELGNALWGGTEGPSNEATLLAVHVSNLRKKVAPLGVEINNVARRGFYVQLREIAESAA